MKGLNAIEKKKSLLHVAMVAKFLDDNKPKIRFQVLVCLQLLMVFTG